MSNHRKTTKMKIEHSVLREDRDKIAIEGQDISEIEVPGILDPDAYDIYQDLAAKVSDLGIIMEIDCYMLSILANDLYEYGQLVTKMKELEYLIYDPVKDTYRRNPLLIAKNKLAENILTVGKLFGLTPINRAGLPIEYEKAKQKAKEKQNDGGAFNDKWGSI